MRFSIKSFSLLLAAGFVVSAGISISSAVAADLDQAELEAENAKAAYDEAVARYEGAEAELGEKRIEIENTRAAVEVNRAKAAASAKALYTSSDIQTSALLDLVLNADDLGDLIADIEGVQRVYDYHVNVLSDTKASLADLERQERDLSIAAENAAAEKDKLAEARDEAIAAFEEAQEVVRPSVSVQDDEVDYPHNWVTGEVECEVTVSVSELRFMGVVYANGWRFTFYEEHVLFGGALDIPQRHHEDGMVCDGDGYVCVASSDLPKGTVVPTPLGRPGKVYDSGCASGTIDLYLV